MSGKMKEIEARYEAIKDHKPRATKKLNELGDILSSAYQLNPDRADEMWQYIVELNIKDDITFSKFYIAQVFNKLIARMKPEDVTTFITMTPERVRLMIQYGYDGGTLWTCLNTLVKGYIKAEAYENVLICLDYFFEKFGGINAEFSSIISVVKNAVAVCCELYKEGKQQDEIENLINEIGNSGGESTRVIVEVIKAVNGIGRFFDYDELFGFARKNKMAVEFFDLLWVAREYFSAEELKEKWIDYVESCEEGEICPYNYIHDNTDNYEESKLKFYVDLECNTDELLDYYFNRNTLYDVEKGVLWYWVEKGDWDRFAKYVSLVVMNTNEGAFDYSSIHRELKDYTEACFFDDCRDSSDRYERSYKELMATRGDFMAEALAKVAAITIGCDCHESFYEFVKNFVQKQTGSVEYLKQFGFDEIVDTRTAEERLLEYVNEFLESGELVHNWGNTKYSLIKDALHEELYRENGGSNITIKIDLTSTILKSLGLNSNEEGEEEEEGEEKTDKRLERDYRFATNDKIAEFYFKHSPGEYHVRQELLSACIRKKDVNRAIELIDLMASTEINDGYDERNGWGRQNMLTIKYLIDEYRYDNDDDWRGKDITDEMRQIARQLVYRMLRHLPEHSQEELKSDMYKIDPEKDDSDEYIKQLLEYAEIYTTFPKPRGKGGAPNINRMSDQFIHCFERLSSMGRLDVVAMIMTKFASVKDILKPVPFTSWMSFMSRGLKDGDLIQVYRNNPEIFEAWITCDNIRDWDIIHFAEDFGSNCTRKEFVEFRNMIISHKGMVEGLDAAFKATSENTENQILFDGDNAKIELDYIDISGGTTVRYLELNFLTTKKTKELDSVRVLACKVNGIETDELGSYSDFDEDDGPDKGFSVFGGESKNSMEIYSDFFDENEMRQVNRIDLQLVLMDDAANVIENMSEIVIQHNPLTGEYEVSSVATSLGTLIEVNKYDAYEERSDLADLLRSLIIDIDDDDEISEGDETDELHTTFDDFEDITFWDENNIRIDFCGLEFMYDNELKIKFWDDNESGQVIKLFAKDICINGNLEETFSSFHTLKDGEHGYAYFNVMDITSVDYDDIKSIDLSVEIDDEECDAIYETMHIHIDCDTDNETFCVKIFGENKNLKNDEEEFTYNADDEFDDISIFNEEDIIVEFCGIEFYSSFLTMKLWCNLYKEEETKLFIKSLKVNGNSIRSWEYIGGISDWESEFMDIDIQGDETISYENITKIELVVEVDDENNKGLGDTQKVIIYCDTMKEAYSVEIVGD